MSLTACSHCQHGQDNHGCLVLSVVDGVNTPAHKTRQFCLVDPVSTFSVILNIFETKQLQIGNWVQTRQNCLVLSPIVFTPQTQTRQDSFVSSVSAV